MSDLKNKIVAELKNILPEGDNFLSEPHIDESDIKSVTETLNSGWVSPAGSATKNFERKIAEFTGSKYVIAMSSGTAALHICYKTAGVDLGDEVICPSLSFVATANAISYCGAIPNFADIEEKTFGIDPEKLRIYLKRILRDGKNKETGRRISAIVVTHCFGHACLIDEIKSVANEFNLKFIEDAAESLGSFYNNKHLGNFGISGCLSFNGNKIITTGAGGALITNDEEIYDMGRALSNVSRKPHKYEYDHDHIGYNYRMPAINASLGLSQISSMEKRLKIKRQFAEIYQKIFSKFDEVNFVTSPENCQSNYWLNCIRVKGENISDIINELHRNKIYARPAWKPLHKLDIYKNSPRDGELPITDMIYDELISLPSGVNTAEISLKKFAIKTS